MESQIAPISTLGSLSQSDTASAQSKTGSINIIDISVEQELSTQAALVYGATSISVPEGTTELSSAPIVYKPANSPIREVTNTANWSTSLQTLLDQPPSTLPRRLILGGIVFCVAFGAWATFGQVDEVGHAQGRLVPKGESYKIHPVVLGKVAHIDIKEGQEVKAGQVLFELDSRIATTEVERLLQEQAGYQTQLIQTQALIDKTSLEANTVAESLKADARATEIAIAQAQAKTQAQEATIAESQEKATTTQALLAQFQKDVVAHQSRLAKMKPLATQGAIGSEQIFQAEESLGERQRSITQSQGELQQTLAQLNRLQAERKQALNEPQRLQAELNKQVIQEHKALVEAQEKIQQLRVKKMELQGKFDDTQKLLTKAKTELKQLSLSAPVDGFISSLNVRNIGEVVKEGQNIAEIVPNNTPLILLASLPNREAGFVKTDMAVQIKFDAYPYQDYGVISGKVISISPDAKPDEKLGSVYQVEVALDRHYIKANHKTVQFKAGQTANAEIIIRRRHIADVLLDPIRHLQKDGMSL